VTRAELAGCAVWPVLAAVLESPQCAGLLADGLGLVLAASAGAGCWLASRLGAPGGPAWLLAGRGCRRLGTSLVVEARSGRGRVRRWLWPGDLPGGDLRRLRVHLECAARAGTAR
jgi:hypothetical protein